MVMARNAFVGLEVHRDSIAVARIERPRVAFPSSHPYRTVATESYCLRSIGWVVFATLCKIAQRQHAFEIDGDPCRCHVASSDQRTVSMSASCHVLSKNALSGP